MGWKFTIMIAAIFLGTFQQSSSFASGKIYYGSRVGMQVTVISIEGLDTSQAIIRTKHTREDATTYCKEYIGTNSEKCVEDELATRLNDEVHANCNIGVFSNFHGDKLQFVGLNERKPGPEYLLKNLATGTFADGSSASGYATNMEIYKALCPSYASSRSAQLSTEVNSAPSSPSRRYCCAPAD